VSHSRTAAWELLIFSCGRLQRSSTNCKHKHLIPGPQNTGGQSRFRTVDISQRGNQRKAWNLHTRDDGRLSFSTTLSPPVHLQKGQSNQRQIRAPSHGTLPLDSSTDVGSETKLRSQAEPFCTAADFQFLVHYWSITVSNTRVKVGFDVRPTYDGNTMNGHTQKDSMEARMAPRQGQI